MNVFDLHVFELLKFAVHSNSRSQLPNIKTLYLHKSAPVFTRSVGSNMFHVPEVRIEVSRQPLNHLNVGNLC